MSLTISAHYVRDADPLTLAALQLPVARPIDPTSRIEPEVARAIVAASVPTTMTPRLLPITVPAPRSARSHLALNPGGTP